MSTESKTSSWRRQRRLWLSVLVLLHLSLAGALAKAHSNFEKAYKETDDEQYKSAIHHLKEWLRERPDDAEGHFQLGRAYMLIDQYGPAWLESNRAIELNPFLGQAYSIRGFCSLKRGQLREGVADLKKAIDRYRLSPDFTLYFDCKNLLEAQRRLGRFDEQSGSLSNRIALYEQLRAAERMREQGRLNEALAKVDEAIGADDRLADLWFFRAVLNSNKRDFWTAVSDLTKAMKLAPDQAVLYYHRGDCYQQLGQHTEALSDFAKVLALNPRIVAFKFVCETGRLRDQLLRKDKVIISLSDIHMLRAQSLASLNRPREAIAELDIAIKQDPEDSMALSRRAEMKLSAGKFDRAISDYSQAIALNPSDWRTMKARADAYLHQGMVEEALIDLDRIVRINPREPGAHFLKANALAATGKIKEAADEYSEVVRLNPDDDDAYLERARCYDKLGMTESALADYSSAERLNADNSEAARAGRALVYEKAGSSELAQSELAVLKKIEEKRGNERRRNSLLFAGLLLFLICSVIYCGHRLLPKIR